MFGQSRAILAVSNNRWTTNELGVKWLQHFIKHTRSIGSHRLLILNGYRNHTTIKFVNLAHENNIVLFYLLPHSTHRLQLLDVAIFGLLLTYYSQSVKENNFYDERGVSKREWII